MNATDEIHRVSLSGTPLDRGRAHGEALRPVIAQGMARWKDALHRWTGLHPEEYLDRFVEATDFLPAIERWAPQLLDEVRGIAEGAGLPYRDVYAYQLMDEEWLFRYDLAREQAAPEHCSLVGVFGEGEGPAILGQNMDLPRCYDGTQTLLRVAPGDGGPEALIFTAAGLIGTCGLNSAAVGLCVNTLGQLAYKRTGLPVAFIMRRLLEFATPEEAAAFLRAVDHASGQNYAIGGPRHIVDFECSANRVESYRPHPTRVYHTNHPLANADLALRSQAAAGAVGKGDATERPGQPIPSNSEQRLAFVAHALDSTAPFTVDDARTVLSSCEVPISVPRTGPGSSMTLGSLVMELSVPPVLHVACGPPADTAYVKVTF